MKERSRGLVVFVTSMVSIAAYGQSPAPASPAQTEMLFEKVIPLVSAAKDAPGEFALKPGDTLECIGDSITARGGYLAYIEQVVSNHYPALGAFKVINAGVSGHKAENLIARFEKDVIARKPTVLTLNIGINDVWHRMRAPHDGNVLAAYKENVSRMVDAAQQAGIRVILLAPTLIQESPAAEGNQRLALYVNAMKEIAAEKKCGFVDLHAMFLEALAKKPADVQGNWVTGDGVHMAPLGNGIMALGVLRALGVPDAKTAATPIVMPPPRKVIPAPPPPVAKPPEPIPEPALDLQTK